MTQDVNPQGDQSPKQPIQSHIKAAEALLGRALNVRFDLPLLNDSDRLRAAMAAQVQAQLAQVEATLAVKRALNKLAENVAFLTRRQGLQ